MSKLKVAISQHPCVDDQRVNLDADIHHIKMAAEQHADLILLPELSTSSYFCISESPAHFDRAESIPGESTEVFQQLARKHQIIIATTLFEKRADSIYHNTAIVIDKDGSLAGIYRKMHIPDDPGFHEKYYFTPGDNEFRPVKTSIGNIGVLICWDQWYPEAARIMALAGADLLVFPSAIGWEQDESGAENHRQLEAWITVQRGHAIANSLPVLVSNRVGLETTADQKMKTRFWGSGFITGQQGELLARASIDNTEIIVAEIDMDRTEQIRRSWPFFRDRRIDAYQAILKRHADS